MNSNNSQQNQKDSPKYVGLTPMMAQYRAIKDQHPDMLLFYQMGEFYELFFEDALTAAQALDIALTKRGQHNGEDIPMCGVPLHTANSYLEKLIKAGFQVAICEQTEDPSEAKKRGAKSVVMREVTRIVTQGTLTEESLLSAKQNNFLASLYPQQDKIFTARIDISTGDFILETIDLTGLNNYLNRIQPAEILLPESFLETPEMFEIFAEWKKQISPLPESSFRVKRCEEELKKIYNTQTLDAFGQFDKGELSSAGALIDYLLLTGRGNIPSLKALKKISSEQILQIDASTRRHLELIKKLDGSRQGSLLATIDYTMTSAGGRMLAERLQAPHTDPNVIHHRLEAVEFYVQQENLRTDLREALKLCPDLERALARLSVQRGGPRDLDVIRKNLQQAAHVFHLHQSFDDQQKPQIKKILGFLTQHDLLCRRLEKALNDELPQHAKDGHFVRDGYLDALDDVRHTRDASQSLIKELEAKYAEQTGINNLKIKQNNVIGYFIEVKPNLKATIEQSYQFMHRQSLASAIRYQTVELSELEQKISSAAEKALQLELQIFQDLVNETMAHLQNLQKLAQSLALLDVMSALAELAIKHRFTRPIVDTSHSFIIEQGRHPVVEETDVAQSFVANDCDLSEDQKLWLLTGPNMAGKSTFLRQNALIIILAQMGSFVPAQKAHIGVVDKLFSRIGAADDLAKGRSTFMVEMIEAATILNQSTSRSFVILDELGRGTATFDGLSIAWACLEYIHNVNLCRTLFATHYHELTQLETQLTNLICYHMAIKEWEGEIHFLHQVKQGSTQKSYGIQVAKLAGLPQQVWQRAQEVLISLEKSSKGKKVSENIMPLFQAPAANITEQNEPTPPSQPHPAIEKLQSIDVDDLSPRQALDILFDLKKLS